MLHKKLYNLKVYVMLKIQNAFIGTVHADVKQEISPAIIPSYLNEVITVFIPIVEGTEAYYYVTNPRGEEKRLNIQSTKKRKKTENTDTIKRKNYEPNNVLRNSFGELDGPLDIQNMKPSIKILLNNKLGKESTAKGNFIQDVLHNSRDNNDLISRTIALHNISENDEFKALPSQNHVKFIDREKNNNYTNLAHSTKAKSHHNSYLKVTGIDEDIQIEKVQGNKVFDAEKHESNFNASIMQLEKLEDADAQLSENIFKQTEYVDSDLKNASDIVTENLIRVIETDEVVVSEVWHFDDKSFEDQRSSKPNFQIGPLMEEDHGNWVLSIYFQNRSKWVELFQVITIDILEYIPANPKAVKLKPGSDYVLSFAYPIKYLQSCELQGPRGGSDKYYDRYGLEPDFCGYIVKNVSKREEGVWRIIGVANIVHEAYSYLEVGEGQLDVDETFFQENFIV